MKLIEAIATQIKRLIEDNFYGEVIIHFKNGVPETMNINKKVKLK